jgi:hypothetical protein
VRDWLINRVSDILSFPFLCYLNSNIPGIHNVEQLFRRKNARYDPNDQ